MLHTKTRPSDGTPEEDKEKERRLEQERNLEESMKEAEEERALEEEDKKRKLEELKKERGVVEEEVEDEITVGGGKVKPQKLFTIKKGVGIFNKKGRSLGYGTDKFDKKIEKKFKSGSCRITDKKQEQFMKLFDRYHKEKRSNLGTVDRDEIIKFTAGLRRGAADRNFGKMCDELKKEGVIKNSADVKKFFTKRELKSMRNSLTGQEDSRLKRPERTSIQRSDRPTRPIRPPR